MHRWHTDNAAAAASTATAVTAAAMSNKMVWKPSQPSTESACICIYELMEFQEPTRQRDRGREMNDDKKGTNENFCFWYEISKRMCEFFSRASAAWSSAVREREEGGRRDLSTKDTYWYFIARHFPCALMITLMNWTINKINWKFYAASEQEWTNEQVWTITRTFRLWSKCNIFIRIPIVCLCLFLYLFCVSITLFLKISRYI